MRGRGTRTAPHLGKRGFVIYDFFRNHQYFNDSDTDVFTGTGGGTGPERSEGRFQPPGDLVELGLEDEWLEAVTYIEVGPEGERVGKEQYKSDWRKTIHERADDDSLLRKIRDDEALSPDEEDELARRLNQPDRYFNEDNLRRAYRDPGGTLVDFIRAAPRHTPHPQPRGEDRGGVPSLACLPVAYPAAGRVPVPAPEPRHRHRPRAD